MIDKQAQDYIELLARVIESQTRHDKIHRFTPSIQAGRRYLAVERDGFIFHIQLDVIGKED